MGFSFIKRGSGHQTAVNELVEFGTNSRRMTF